VGPRARYLPLVAVLGAALGGLPALATSAGSPPVVNGLETKHWSPSEVTIGAGGSVIFKNASTTVEHSLKFLSGPAKPVCTGTPESGKTNWEGSCSFSTAGTYDFFCTVHPGMTGSVVVTPGGTTTTTTTTTGTTTTTTTTTTGTTPTTTTDKHTTTGPGSNPGSPESGTPGGSGSPGAGGLSGGAHLSLSGAAVALASVQHGKSVHGTVLVPSGGSRLVVQLLAAAGQISKSGPSTPVGSLTRSHLHAGRVSFTVAITPRAQRVLHRRGHLKLLVRLTLSAPGAGSAHRSLTVQLRAG
jgi:plastocyanin